MLKVNLSTTDEGLNSKLERARTKRTGTVQGYRTNPIPLIISRAHLYTT